MNAPTRMEQDRIFAATTATVISEGWRLWPDEMPNQYQVSLEAARRIRETQLDWPYATQGSWSLARTQVRANSIETARRRWRSYQPNAIDIPQSQETTP